MGFEPVTSRYRCNTLTNWAMKPLKLGAGHLWILMSPWRMNVKLYMRYFIYWTTDVKSSKLWSSRSYKRNICNCVHRNLNIQDFNGVWTSNPKLAEIEILSTVARGNVKGMWDIRLLSAVVGRTRHPRASSRVIHGFIWYLFIPRTLTNAANGYFYWTRSIIYPTTQKWNHCHEQSQLELSLPQSPLSRMKTSRMCGWILNTVNALKGNWSCQLYLLGQHYNRRHPCRPEMVKWQLQIPETTTTKNINNKNKETHI